MAKFRAGYPSYTLLLLSLLLSLLLHHGPSNAVSVQEENGESDGGNDPVVHYDLSQWMNNRGFGNSNSPGNFDGANNYFAQGDSATIYVGAVPYLTRMGERYDNIEAGNQTLSFNKSQTLGALHLLVSSSYGPVRSNVKVNYEDGTYSNTQLTVPDWQVQFHNQIDRIDLLDWKLEGNPATIQGALFSVPVYTDPTKAASSITIETLKGLHIFAATAYPSKGLRIVSARPTTQWQDNPRNKIVRVRIQNTAPSWAKSIRVEISGSGINTMQEGLLRSLAPGHIRSINVVISAEQGSIHATVTANSETLDEIAKQDFDLFISHPEPYQPTEGSITAHVAPDWITNAKFGIFIHWGVYSVPAWGPVGKEYAEWYWYQMNHPDDPTYDYHKQTYGIDFNYDDFVNNKTLGSQFDPKHWLDIIQSSRARYFVLTSKHHEGFALWNTSVSGRSLAKLGPKRDFIKELMDAAKGSYPQLKRGLYFSMPEWYNPVYHDPSSGGEYNQWNHNGPPKNPYTNKTLNYTGAYPIKDFVADLQTPQAKELINNFDLDIFWCDIGGVNNAAEWQALFFNQAADKGKQVTVNNRCGLNTSDYDTPEYEGLNIPSARFWEATRGIDPYSFGYNYATPDDKYASVGDLLIQLIDSASQGGNLLLDMGPAATGRVPGPMVSRLQAMGSWIDSVGQESFFNTSIYWAAMTTTDLNNSTVRIRFLAGPDDSAFYIYSLDRPSEKLIIDVPVPIHSQSVITSGKQNTQLSWSHDTQGRLSITVPENVINDGQYVWLFKVDNSKV